jgi:hypothetical protein
MQIKDTNRRIVWILGAGFSRSLGGPLLADLFRQRHVHDLRETFPRSRFGTLANESWLVQKVFNEGKNKEKSWTDAEQFLSWVDGGLHTGTSVTKFVERTLGKNSFLVAGSGSDPSRAARRALAAECHLFLDTNTSSESWSPYREWNHCLDRNDTVISFNYDRVVEELLGDATTSILLPGNRARTDVPRVLKLHGSIDWLIRNSGACERVGVDEALAERKDIIAIASPGPTKLGTHRARSLLFGLRPRRPSGARTR